jgi:hypothetical protein
MNAAEALAQLARAMLNGGPPRPEGVRVRVDGQLIEAAELSYIGQNAQGTHEWRATFNVAGDDIDGVHIDRLPGHTAVVISCLREPEDSP